MFDDADVAGERLHLAEKSGQPMSLYRDHPAAYFQRLSWIQNSLKKTIRQSDLAPPLWVWR
jgi:hypothetical protein